MRTAMKRAVGAGILAGMGYAVWRVWRSRVPEPRHDVEWEAAPFPFPPVPRPAPRPGAEANAVEPVVDPNADGSCPASHPVKAKTSSGIFHVPGGANYERTRADRCYVDAEAAEADGLRPSKH